MKHFIYVISFLLSYFVFSVQAQADNVTFTESNLPIIVIQTTEAINADTKVPGTMKIINNGEGQVNHLTDAAADYDGAIGIKWRGESSLNFNQKKYTVETWDAEGNDLKVSLLGMPEESDWVLLAPYNDVSMVRDVFAYYMWNAMGHWGPRTQMCEVVVNGQYMGVYAFCERIKRDKNRVDISKLKPEDVEGCDVTGGYIVRIDAYDEEDETFPSKVKGIQKQNWNWGGGSTTEATVTWTIYYPKKEDLQPAQRDYIRGYIDQVETTIQSADFTDPLTGYASLVDVASFVDYFIHTEVSLNADGFKRSAYFYKEKDKKDGTQGLLFAGPVWDFNLAYGNCNFCNANNVQSWVYQGCETNPTPVMWQRLLQDPAFANAVKRRYLELRQTILSEEAIDQFLDSYATLLDQAKDRQLKRYSEVLQSNNPWDFGPTSFFAAYRVSSYAEEIATVKQWFRRRLAFLDAHMPGSADAPSAIRQPVHNLDATLTVQGGNILVACAQPLSRIDVIDATGACLRSQPVNTSHSLSSGSSHLSTPSLSSSAESPLSSSSVGSSHLSTPSLSSTPPPFSTDLSFSSTDLSLSSSSESSLSSSSGSPYHATVSLSGLGHGLRILVCYTTTGNMVSRSIYLR